MKIICFISIFVLFFFLTSKVCHNYKLQTSPSYHFYNTSDQVKSKYISFIYFLDSFVGCQNLFVEMNLVDLDNDTFGEFGYFSELAGTSRCRGTNSLVVMPYMENIKIISPKKMEKQNYNFMLYLPTDFGENNTNMNEKFWICFAWPKKNNKKMLCSFLVNQSGTIFCTLGSNKKIQEIQCVIKILLKEENNWEIENLKSNLLKISKWDLVRE